MPQRGASSPSAVRVRLGAAAALLVAPCRGADHNGGADRLRPRRPMGHGLGPGGHGPPPWRAGEPVAFPRALRSQAGGAPSTIRRAPPRPCRAGSAHTRRSSRRPPHRLGPRCPACSTARPRLLRRRCSHRGRGTLVVGAGPWARIAPGVDHGEGTPPKARARRPLDGPGAHRVGDLRGPSPRSGPHRSWTPGGGGYRAPSCPGVQADDHRIQAARVGAVPLGYPPRGERARPAPRRPPVPEGPTSESTVLAALPLPRVGTRRRSRLAPVVAQVIGQLSGQPAFQGHSSSEAGSRPSVPVITGPARIDPLEQAVQRPTRTQLLHHTRARQHEPSHHQSSRIDPFKSRGYTDN